MQCCLCLSEGDKSGLIGNTAGLVTTDINEQNLSASQIVFVNKVIDYIENNGYVEGVTELTKPPFGKPQSFIKLFDNEKRERLISIINGVKENAVKIIS